MTPEQTDEKRTRALEYFRQHNAKRAADPVFMAEKRLRDKARHERIKGTEKFREGKRRAAKAAAERDPVKTKIRRDTRRAIEKGILVRQPCEVCGEVKVDAHHDDYSKPLSVRWLCRTHHAEHHRNARTGAGQ